MTSAIKAVIFDLDDTLYPERAYAFSGFATVAAAFQERLGDPAMATTAMRRLFDTEHRRRVFNALLEENALPEDPRLVESMIQTYRTHKPAIHLYPDADTVLTRLRGRFKLGLITDGPTVSQWNKIDALGLRDRLDEIIVTGELGIHDMAPPAEGDEAKTRGGENAVKYAKPHPLAFEVMAKRLGVRATACAYVADNPAKDFIAPNALGWKTVRIIRPDGIYRNAAPVPAGTPGHVIDDLDRLPACLG